jgi:lysophospholipase L1-like esterase
MRLKTIITNSSLLLLIYFSTSNFVCAQQQYYKEVQQFKKQDSLTPPPKDPVLFIGSSSFTKWKDVQDYFPGVPIVNRGFGGSRLLDVIHYASDVIFPYTPRKVVIYAGENDIAYSDAVTTQQVLNRFKSLFYLIRGVYESVPVVYVSIKPSIARKQMMPRMKAANTAIKKFLDKERNTTFVNVYDKMLLPGGIPDPSNLIEDSLHMNAKGYAIWKSALDPHLKQ